ncbi:low molecular weight protein tyrosine phosphatase family protein (plasmid) [Paraburkholderia sp. PREW-6R]|uniref:low molecular weight protein tyrosine phosphatase family protein n=1 Tax=Paraburkholderia sp. PREW-6R TaxID=3141544 RepID=UPI0031F49ECD
MIRALFVCSRNRLRSPTAEAVFAAWPGVETDSAGLAPDAETVLSAEQIEWAQVIFVMERAHKTKISKGFSSQFRDKKIVCLDIPDRYKYMQPELVMVLKKKVERFLRS